VKSKAAALIVASAVFGGRTPIVRYSDELVSAKSGRTAFTRAPATLGGILGFLVGVPVDIVALPATYAVYSSQSSATRDPLSIFLFPSFVLWRVGTLIAAPIDAVEWGVWRWWQPDETLTPEDRERIERELDELQMQWTDYPVEWIYPRAPRG
jgi:hypothetical protein